MQDMDLIKRIQEYFGFSKTGQYDPLTEAAVKNIQRNNEIYPDGKLDDYTVNLIFEGELTTDFLSRVEVSGDLVIDRRHMPDREYIKTETKKEYIFLHHTAGWDNPYNVIHGWTADTRGRIGTQYVIGGQNVTNVSHKYDGVIVEAFPKEYYAYHLGIGATYMHSRSVGIELCNFGYLTKEGTKFYTYTKREVDPSQVVTLKKDFRGFRHFHRYSDNQISALKKLLIKISNDHSIDLKGGLYTYFNSQDPFVALDYKDDVKKGLVKGVFSHTNVIMSGKWDIFPQDEMIDMIKSI